tara:strand:- start:1612 stop:2145 length:534 start_codon:yes stop_codon:yes gene_type:complete
MTYFNYFPLMAYDIKGDKNYKLVTELIKRVKVRNAIKDGLVVFDKYDVKYGENPEDIAFKYYDDAELHWVVLLVNNIVDRYYEWPLTDPQFQLFLTDKYGAGSEDAIHHYELAQTSGPTSSSDDSHMLEVNSDTDNATPITNREYEEREQNKLRQIRLLDRRYVSQFVEEFERLIRE